MEGQHMLYYITSAMMLNVTSEPFRILSPRILLKTSILTFYNDAWRQTDQLPNTPSGGASRIVYTVYTYHSESIHGIHTRIYTTRL